tara:strand:- start:173 stop:400 length:228 start_codon:yes stop_codon:yes gene_type:complete
MVLSNVEITAEDLNELRQLNPLAVAQLHGIALERIAKENKKEETISMSTMTENKWWLKDNYLRGEQRSKTEGFDT